MHCDIRFFALDACVDKLMMLFFVIWQDFQNNVQPIVPVRNTIATEAFKRRVASPKDFVP
jgi:hypothetical protein